MVWTRGSKDDWDRYAEVTGDNGWSWDAMLPYMLKVACYLFNPYFSRTHFDVVVIVREASPSQQRA